MESGALSGRIGVMQGRLSPRQGDRLQAFPQNSWRQEFSQARALGFECMEWIFLADTASDNPLASAQGRREIVSVIATSGVPVGSICAPYFMVHKLAGVTEPERAENVQRLRELVVWAHAIGATRILLPLLETAALTSLELQDQAVQSLRSAARVARMADIVLGLEMEIPGAEYAAFIDRVAEPNVRAYYDAGNSTAQGFDIAEDVLHVLPHLEAVHIKDRKAFGKSRPLGCGDANFRGLFAALAKRGFAGDFVFEHYFESDPIAEAAQGLAYIEQCVADATRNAA
ncbi:MAG TPA: sugar phosphate isomerase/epimerase family protein [Polyangiaceae bacterium]